MICSVSTSMTSSVWLNFFYCCQIVPAQRALFIWIKKNTHFTFCLCVMLISSGSTVLYLCGHMRRMVANGQSLSCPQFRNQVRVTVTGILQGVLYVLCALWTMHKLILKGDLNVTFVDSTVINLYMAGTLFNLGAGQAVFRQRAAHIWLRVAQCCKAPQVQPSEEEEDAEAQTRRPGLC
ncbi:taste receptor, type 2, member 201, tandem duplicate 1 [Clinocottus analis]|uniref:taste receptor, type 2, member 201, tandem duplicate 1 n=1 Tax=Clinocottus analis TaxID=304258 RepID=UPI0035C01C5A